MANVLEIIVQAQDKASDVLEGIGQAGGEAASFIEENWLGISAVTAGAGAALEGMNRKQAPLTESIRKTAAAMGLEEDAVREMAGELSNVTFPLEDVAALMESGRQQGIESAEQLKEYATFWDTVGDATGEAGPALGEAGKALRGVGIAAGDEAEALDAFGFITDHTTGSVEDFLRFIERGGPELREMGADVDDAAALLGVLEGEMGMSARTARSELSTAISEANGDMDEALKILGVSSEQFDEYRGKVDGSADVIERNAQIHAESYTPIQRLQHGVEELQTKYAGLFSGLEMLAPVLMAMGPTLMIVSKAKGALTLATSGLSKAMGFLAANPIVLVIAALAALAAGIYLLWQNSETFRNIVLNVWEAIQNAVKAAWENVIKPVWEAIQVGIDFLIEAIKLYLKIWIEVFKAVGEFIKKVWENVIKPAWEAVQKGIDSLIEFAKRLRTRWNEFWKGIGEFIKSTWNNVIKPLWQALQDGIDVLIDFARKLKERWNNFWRNIGQFIRDTWNNVVKPLWERFQRGIDRLIDFALKLRNKWNEFWSAVGQKVRDIWNNVISGTWNTLRSGIDKIIDFARKLRDRWRDFWNAVGSKARDIYNNTIRPVWDTLIGGIESILDAARGLRDSWGPIWNGIKNGIKSPINGIIGFFNRVLSGIEKMVNGVASAINRIPSFSIPSWVPGIGGNSFGLPHIPSVSLPRIPSLQSGGIVKATPGGVLSLLAEGGRHERVSPIGGPDDPMVEIKSLLQELIKAVKASRTLSVDGRDLAAALGDPFVEEIRARTGL